MKPGCGNKKKRENTTFHLLTALQVLFLNQLVGTSGIHHCMNENQIHIHAMGNVSCNPVANRRSLSLVADASMEAS